MGRGLIVAPSQRLATWERRWPARLPLRGLAARAGFVRGFLLVSDAEARRHARWLASWEPDLVVVEQARSSEALDGRLPQASWRLTLLHPRADPDERHALERWLDPWSTPPHWWSGRTAAQARDAA